ncbi:hypothetical protein SAMN04488515_1119 [Cognatiyoonia koreensis]|uniref:DUF2059 domain-containing protein n=2 Tax=Cognatiyoonia koreensis TaxID=364200 RepID=A0A1I0PAP7_9RHOB|nr:hypothetical protein SAMN04488515_1119 [Cognatiyoonia koreensis]
MFSRLSYGIALFTAVAVGGTLSAQDSEADKIGKLYDVLALADLLSIMREEGLAYGEDIGTDLFMGDPGPDWDKAVSTIYNLDRMEAEVKIAFATDLADDDIDSMIAFFDSDLGRTIINLEVSAREALLDETVEEASKEAAALALADEDPRMELIKTYADVNNIVEANVVGAMNANFAFYIGLMDGGAFPQALSEEEILADVWSQEPDIRTNTTEWVYSFLYLAYQPLADEDIQAYIDFSETEAGRDINNALFSAFDGMFEDISKNLGRASSRFMTRQEL